MIEQTCATFQKRSENSHHMQNESQTVRTSIIRYAGQLSCVDLYSCPPKTAHSVFHKVPVAHSWCLSRVRNECDAHTAQNVSETGRDDVVLCNRAAENLCKIISLFQTFFHSFFFRTVLSFKFNLIYQYHLNKIRLTYTVRVIGWEDWCDDVIIKMTWKAAS